MIRWFFIILVFTCYGQNKIVEQDSVILSPNNISDLHIEPYQVVWKQQVIEPNGKTRDGINTITDIVKIDTIQNKPVLKRTLNWLDINNNYYTKTDVVDYESLTPISIDIRWNPSYMQHSDFNNESIVSTSLRNNTSTSKISVSQLKENGFTWSSDGFILVTAKDLELGLFFMKTLSGLPHNAKTQVKAFEIIGEDKINVLGIGLTNTKIIKDYNSGGGTIATYWLSTNKPYIVKVKFEQKNGQITNWQIFSLSDSN